MLASRGDDARTLGPGIPAIRRKGRTVLLLLAEEPRNGYQEESEGRKRFGLTDAGRAYVDDRDESLPPPWDTASGGVTDEALELGRLAQEVGFAFMQVLRAGSKAQIEQARQVLINTRRELYRILAEGEPEMDPADQGDA